jgi:hypothetical protein
MRTRRAPTVAAGAGRYDGPQELDRSSGRIAMRIDKAPCIAFALALATVLVACDRETQQTANQKLDSTLERSKEDLARAGEQIKPTLEKAGAELREAGEKVKPALDKAGAKISEAAHSDAAITTSIKADYLKDPDLSVFKIDVDTNDGVVTLNGVTETPSARLRAEKLAAAVKGVKEVRNHLTVKQG